MELLPWSRRGLVSWLVGRTLPLVRVLPYRKSLRNVARSDSEAVIVRGWRQTAREASLQSLGHTAFHEIPTPVPSASLGPWSPCSADMLDERHSRQLALPPRSRSSSPRADHARAADVDVLDRLGLGHAHRDRLLERMRLHTTEGRSGSVFRRLHVLRLTRWRAYSQDRGVQRLHATVEHLWNFVISAMSFTGSRVRDGLRVPPVAINSTPYFVRVRGRIHETVLSDTLSNGGGWDEAWSQ